MLKRLVLVTILFSLLIGVGYAQDIEPSDESTINPDANISFPPPVYTLRGEIDILGTANLAGMTNYFIEFRPLDLSIDADPDRPWFPVTLPSTQPIINGILGTMNTQNAPDGLYEMRLTINTGVEPQFFRVSPLRIENEVSEFAPQPVVTEAVIEPTEPSVVAATPIPTRVRPTLPPTPTQLGQVGPPPTRVPRVTPTATPFNSGTVPTQVSPTFDASPRVTATVNANVRLGDGLNYPIIARLLLNQTASVIGISSGGTGWYYIQLPDGGRGFISPTVVSFSGDLSNVPFIAPPPPPATPTPTPVPATATPVTQANLVPTNLVISPHPLSCGTASAIQVTLQNNGAQATLDGGLITVDAILVSSGQVLSSTQTVFPAMAAGATYTASAFLTVSTNPNELQRIRVTIDSANSVPETNEGDNVGTFNSDYALQQGICI